MKRHPMLPFAVLTAVFASLTVAVSANSHTIGPWDLQGDCQEHVPRHNAMYRMEASLDATYGPGSDFFLYDDNSCGYAYGYAAHPTKIAYASMYAQFGCDEDEVATTVYGEVVGGGCSYVAGPNGAAVLPEAGLIIEGDSWKTVSGIGSLALDHLSSPIFRVHFDPQNTIRIDEDFDVPL